MSQHPTYHSVDATTFSIDSINTPTVTLGWNQALYRTARFKIELQGSYGILLPVSTPYFDTSQGSSIRGGVRFHYEFQNGSSLQMNAGMRSDTQNNSILNLQRTLIELGAAFSFPQFK